MKLLFPLAGIGKIPGVFLTQKFGQKLMDYSQFGLIGHNGIDWAAPKGYPVHAITDGFIVEATAKDTGYGLRVSQYFEADGFEWIATYGHFQKINYPDIPWTNWNFNKRDIPVKAGQVIGFVNSSGYSSGDHLHLTLQKFKDGVLINPGNGYGGAVDPMPYLEGEPLMNQAKIVKSKNSETVYWCYPMPSMEYLQDKANLEGAVIPNPIPNSDSL